MFYVQLLTLVNRKSCSWLTLIKIYSEEDLGGDLIETYKILTGNENIRPMALLAHDPSSPPPQELVSESLTRNLGCVSCVLVPGFSGTRNLDGIGLCSILHQKLGITWLTPLVLVVEFCLHSVQIYLYIALQ